jgi:hypothetical protein
VAFASSGASMDQAPPEGMAVNVSPSIFTVTTPGASMSVVPLIDGVVSVVIASAPPAMVTTGGEL